MISALGAEGPGFDYVYEIPRSPRFFFYTTLVFFVCVRQRGQAEGLERAYTGPYLRLVELLNFPGSTFSEATMHSDLRVHIFSNKPAHAPAHALSHTAADGAAIDATIEPSHYAAIKAANRPALDAAIVAANDATHVAAYPTAHQAANRPAHAPAHAFSHTAADGAAVDVTIEPSHDAALL